MVSLKPKKRDTDIAPYVAQLSGHWEGDDGNWTTFNIAVGTPPQSFRVLPATVDSIITVPADQSCTGPGLNDVADCGDLRGVDEYNGAASRGFVTSGSTKSSTWQDLSLYSIHPYQNESADTSGIFGRDTVALQGQTSGQNYTVKNQVVAASISKDFWFGSIGLGNTVGNYYQDSLKIPSFLYYLKQAGIIPSLSYSYTAGQSYNGIPGSLIIGGYDANRLPGSMVNTSITNNNGVQTLEIDVTSIRASGTLSGGSIVSPLDQPVKASIDSSISHLWLPQTVCDKIEEAFNLTWNEGLSIYTVNDTVHSALVASNATLAFNVGTGDAGAAKIVLSYNALDMLIGYPYYSADQRYFPMKRAANSSQITLGRTFLQEAYLIVDWEGGSFSIGQTVRPGTTVDAKPITASSTASPSSTSAAASNGGGSSGIGAGAIAGIVIALLAIIAIAAGVLFWRRRRRSRRAGAHNHHNRASWWSMRKSGDAPPPYPTEPEFYNKPENEMSESKTPEAHLSELPGSNSHTHHELTSETVASRLEQVVQDRELMSTPVAELHAGPASSELDSDSIRARDSLASGNGTVRSSLASPRRTSGISALSPAERARSPPIDESLVELP